MNMLFEEADSLSEVKRAERGSLVRGRSLGYLVQKYRTVLILCMMLIVGGVASPHFFELSNFMTVIKQSSIIAVLAAGMTLVILTGGIDLSVGSVVAICGAFAASIAGTHGNALLAVVVALAFGAVIGLANGVLITKGLLPPFIVTLATMAGFRGMSLAYTNAQTIPVLNKNFVWIGQGSIGFLPVPLIIMVVVYVALWVFLTQVRVGRYIYAVGNNEEATRYSGINTNAVILLTYVICGFLAALGGLILVARLYSAQATNGVGFELDAIAAVILGGTSLSGGKGGIPGTIVGVFIMGVLANILNLTNVSPFYQDIAKCLIILVAVLIDSAVEHSSLRSLPQINVKRGGGTETKG